MNGVAPKRRATSPLLRWTPRVLGIAFALFLSLFALDVFEQPASAGEHALALLLHLVPTFAVLLATAVGWRHERPGALLFAGLGAAYIALAWGRFPLVTYVVIAGPLFVVAALLVAAARRAHPAAGGTARVGSRP